MIRKGIADERVDFGAVDAKLANGIIADFDREKLGITQIRRVLNMIYDSALLELASRLSHLIDRASELYFKTGSYDTGLFDSYMDNFDRSVQTDLNKFPAYLQISSTITKVNTDSINL